MTKNAIRKRIARALANAIRKGLSSSSGAIRKRIDRAKDPNKVRLEARISAKKRYEKIKTGFPPGRPRKGELRPVSVGALKCQAWRMKNLEYYREKNRMYQRIWRSNNLERSREIKRNSDKRKRAWKNGI